MTNEEMQNKWAWGQECDERYKMCDSESEAHGEAQFHIDNECIQGDEAEYMIGRVCHPMDRLGMDWVARNIAETIEEINEVLGSDIHDEPSGELEFVRAIEAKLKEKNT